MPMEYTGLSPRGRGNLPVLSSQAHRPGSIPAWAGQPVGRQSVSAMRWVYPRVGGATTLGHTQPSRVKGLSPRGRGNLGEIRLALFLERSIPAWAGQPQGGRM